MTQAAKILPFDQTRPARPGKPSKTMPPPGLTLHEAFDSWEIALQARATAPSTIKSYLTTINVFAAWLDARDLPGDVESITVEHVRLFLASERERTSAGNAHKHFRYLRALFRWCIGEEEPLRTSPSPVLRSDEPKVATVERVPLTDDQLRAVLATCRGTDFADRRDLAILMLLIDCGPRRTGIANIRYTPETPATHDLALKERRVRIVLKGGDRYEAPFGSKTAQAIDRYLRARGKHRQKREPWLWLSPKGRLTADGLYQMIVRRGEEAGIQGLHPHQFRRTSVTRLLDAGAGEVDAMYIMGWTSTAMVRHYSQDTARERARTTHARLSPGDRI